MTRRQKILAAAEAGLISFYEGVTHDEIEFDSDGNPQTIALTHGVCQGCVWDVADGKPGKVARCCIYDPHHRAATVEEVAAYIGAVP